MSSPSGARSSRSLPSRFSPGTKGFGLNRVTAVASVLYAFFLILFVLATKKTTAANAIFFAVHGARVPVDPRTDNLQRRFRSRDLITVLVCLGAMALFFVGQLRPQDVTGNIFALTSGLFFALYFLYSGTHAPAKLTAPHQ